MNLRQHEPLAALTSWKVGGSARYFVELDDISRIGECHQLALENDVPMFVIGRGSNVLIPDGTLDALVVSTRHATHCEVKGDIVIAEGGVFLPNLSRLARKSGLAGFGFGIGIPGTVGAAVAINAGIGGVGGPCIADVLVEAEVYDLASRNIETVPAAAIELGYRTSGALHKKIVISAVMRATGSASPEELAIEERNYLRDRKARQPLNDRSCGSVFKPTGDGTAAGVLIDKAGMKGTRIGDAVISDKHANWILNEGNASAHDIRELIELVQKTVMSEFGETLDREVVLLPDDVVSGRL